MKKSLSNLGIILSKQQLKAIKGSLGGQTCTAMCPNGAPSVTCSGDSCEIKNNRCYYTKTRFGTLQTDYVPCQLGISHIAPV
ncbi:hypothetical protein [Spongiimicrobium salis]|uniref:hypothetical protein n=1 Tax=Spongiimicrobium salis TaxID=1667022 RepID=UPI00374D553C